MGDPIRTIKEGEEYLKKVETLIEYFKNNDVDEDRYFHIDYIAKNILNLSEEEIIEYKKRHL